MQLWNNRGRIGQTEAFGVQLNDGLQTSKALVWKTGRNLEENELEIQIFNFQNELCTLKNKVEESQLQLPQHFEQQPPLQEQLLNAIKERIRRALEEQQQRNELYIRQLFNHYFDESISQNDGQDAVNFDFDFDELLCYLRPETENQNS